jgi:hypothetical protein
VSVLVGDQPCREYADKAKEGSSENVRPVSSRVSEYIEVVLGESLIADNLPDLKHKYASLGFIKVEIWRGETDGKVVPGDWGDVKKEIRSSPGGRYQRGCHFAYSKVTSTSATPEHWLTTKYWW